MKIEIDVAEYLLLRLLQREAALFAKTMRGYHLAPIERRLIEASKLLVDFGKREIPT